jgi:hypothetical protein
VNPGGVFGRIPNPYPGKLFIVEGIDGSGKSTQLGCSRSGCAARATWSSFSEWNSSPIVREPRRRGKKSQLLTPLTFSLIHATDFSDRVEREIVPALKAGAIVLADRTSTRRSRATSRAAWTALGALALPVRGHADARGLLPRAAGRGALPHPVGRPKLK